LLTAYGLSAYAIFLGAFAVFIGFIENLGLPRSIDVGPDTPPLIAAAWRPIPAVLAAAPAMLIPFLH
jgi:hypothetical protein